MNMAGRVKLYTTENELEFAYGLYERNRVVFLKYSRQIIENGRRWDGPGMNININLLKNRIRELLEAHNAETDPMIPALRAKKSTNIQ